MSLRQVAQSESLDEGFLLKRQSEALEFRDKLTGILTSAQDFSDVVDRVFKEVIDYSGAEGGIFRLANERTGTLDVYQTMGPLPKTLEKLIPRRFGDGLAGYSAQSGETMIFFIQDDLYNDKELLNIGIRSVLALPLRAKENVIGVLEIFSKNDKGFDEQIVKTLSCISRQIGLALEGMRLVETLEHRITQRNRMYRLMLKLQSRATLDELLFEIVNILSDIYAPAYSVIVLYDPEDQILRLKAASQRFMEEIGHKEIALGEGIIGYAAKSRSALLINDTMMDPRYIKGVLEVSSELAVPMIAEGKLVGVLDIESPLLNAFKEDDLQLLTIYAQQAAMAILNAQLYEQAREQNLAKSRMMSALSHEFRTPLSVIKSYAWYVKNKKEIPADELDEQLDVVLSEVDNLNELIENLLNIARLEQGRMEWNAVNFEVTGMIKGLIDMFMKTASERGITIALEAKGEAFTWGDVSRTRQAILNIISNAIKYNKDAGRIRIEVDSSERNFTRVSIEDTGIGIKPQELEKIFVPFYRVGGSKIEGVGLGLSITKQFIEAQGGWLDVKSVFGEGTVFNVYLPARGSNEQ